MANLIKLTQEIQFSKTKLCRFEPLGLCSKGTACPFAHGRNQLKPAPDLRGTKLCKQYISFGLCTIPDCTFAHSGAELNEGLDRLAASTEIVTALTHPTIALTSRNGAANVMSSFRNHDSSNKPQTIFSPQTSESLQLQLSHQDLVAIASKNLGSFSTPFRPLPPSLAGPSPCNVPLPFSCDATLKKMLDSVSEKSDSGSGQSCADDSDKNWLRGSLSTTVLGEAQWL